MTRSEHSEQRDRVAGSLRADDMRETHRAVYPVRTRETGRDAVQAPRCGCPDDCGCRYPWRPTYCGCIGHA